MTFSDKFFGSIHIRPDGTMRFDIPEGGDYYEEGAEKARLMFDFIAFVINNQDCINLFNTADHLHRSHQEMLTKQAQVEKKLEDADFVLDADEIWEFIDRVNAGKVTFKDSPGKSSYAKDVDWLLEKNKKITYH